MLHEPKKNKNKKPRLILVPGYPSFRDRKDGKGFMEHVLIEHVCKISVSYLSRTAWTFELFTGKLIRRINSCLILLSFSIGSTLGAKYHMILALRSQAFECLRETSTFYRHLFMVLRNISLGSTAMRGNTGFVRTGRIGQRDGCE